MTLGRPFFKGAKNHHLFIKDSIILITNPTPLAQALVIEHGVKKSGIDYAYAPSIEAFETPFTVKHADQGDYPVVGLGPVGRWWQPRASLAGTYDEEWKATRCA